MSKVCNGVAISIWLIICLTNYASPEADKAAWMVPIAILILASTVSLLVKDKTHE